MILGLVFFSMIPLGWAADNGTPYHKTLYEGCSISFQDIDGGTLGGNEEVDSDSVLYKNSKSIYTGISFTCQTVSNENGSQSLNGEGNPDFMGIDVGKIKISGAYLGKYPVRKVNRVSRVVNKNGYVFEVADLMYSWSESSKKTHRIIRFCTTPKYQLCGSYDGGSEEKKLYFQLTPAALEKFLGNLDIHIALPNN